MYGIVVLERDGLITAGHTVKSDTPEEWAEAEEFLLQDFDVPKGRYGHTLLAGDRFGRTMHHLVAPRPGATFTVVYPLADALAEGWTERDS